MIFYMFNIILKVRRRGYKVLQRTKEVTKRRLTIKTP